MEVRPRQVEIYVAEDGGRPFEQWLASLRDTKARARIRLRLVDRISQGNLGKCEPVGQGVFELKDDCGPGYRIYFGQVGQTVILLLCGGDKSTQDQDIRRAKEYWADYERQQNAKD